MKICFLIYSLGSGGAERAITGLANYWAKEHQVTIITLVESAPFYKLQREVELKYCLKKTKEITTTFSSLLDGLKRLRRLIIFLKEARTDVLLSFMHTSNIYSIWACKLLGIPCIISERANHNVYQLPKIHKKLRNFSYPYANTLVVQTLGNKIFYEKYFKTLPIKIIPNAVSTDFKTKKKSKKQNESMILNVGSFKDGKAQDLLIRAFAKLENKDWKLIFLGKGPNLENFKKLSRELEVAGHVEFRGVQKNVASYYNQAQLFVFTSEHEGFPNALLEALYFGVPSISTNCPHGPADMITDGENGFLVPVGDVDVLAEKMELLMNSEALQEKFRNNALKSTQKYEMEAIAHKWMEVIKKATAQ